MACFSCGAAFKGTDMDRVRRYKEYYDTKGLETYFFTTETGGQVRIVRKSGFNAIYQSLIKPNLDKGAEYEHIKAFTG